ncbi:MAG: glycoside hydrolase family 2 [Ruminococcaceae bacterium]|nr:glycoside hydrolase family 2 [Oscillospiraceae bacterium]
MGEIPHSEYPRPQFVRDSFLCLNGEWKLSKIKDGVTTFSGAVTVPFSPEAENSGVANGFKLEKDELLVYERKFNIDKNMLLGATKLHFGAVDSYCKVFVNGKLACSHRGGYTPFETDIAELIFEGENTLRFECTDTTEDSHGARGKQSSTPGGIWYTPQSGIWQTVWLESMPTEHIKDITVKTDAIARSVTIATDYDGEQELKIFDGSDCFFETTFKGSICVNYEFDLWSPEHPKLYDFELTTSSGDSIRSYFGVRSFGIGKDNKGKPRLLLNGRPYFMSGVLDQGYWCDGLLTYPSEQAVIDELKMLKDMGFNMIRKHIKIEPMRWYYHCDKLGFVVWQDFVNGGGEYKFTHIAAFPFLGFKHKDNDYKYFSRENEEGRAEFEQSVYETVNALKNCTSIGVWVPFNEGWGQFDSEKYTKLIKELDDTRIIDSVSGWHDQGVGKTELKSLHTYYTPLKVPKDKRPVVLSEFGGYSLKIDGHVFNENKEFGYKKFKDTETFCQSLEKLYLNKVLPLLRKGLCGCVYTQVSDVEEEINGLVTYDRKVIKISPERMNAINQKLYEQANNAE